MDNMSNKSDQNDIYPEEPNQTFILTCEEDILTYIRPQYEDFDLKTLLITSPLGKSVLTYYESYKKLDNTRRNRLCSIIVKHLFNYIVK